MVAWRLTETPKKKTGPMQLSENVVRQMTRTTNDIDMNKLLILSIVACMTLTGTETMAQRHRHTPRTETASADSLQELHKAAKTAAKSVINVTRIGANTALQQMEKDLDKDMDEDGGLAAYSDTTQAADADSMAISPVAAADDADFPEPILSTMFRNMGPKVIVPVLVCFILFVMAPVLILFVIFYFIYRDRRQRMRIAETAIKNGQPVPEGLFGRKNRRSNPQTYVPRPASQPMDDHQYGGTSGRRERVCREAAPAGTKSPKWEIPLWFDGRDPQIKRCVRYCFWGAIVALFGYSTSTSFFFGCGILLIVYGLGIGAFALIEQRRDFQFEQMEAAEAQPTKNMTDTADGDTPQDEAKGQE